MTRGDAEGLVVGELFESWPETPLEREALRREALANPLYENVFLSSDETMAAIAITASTYSEVAGPADELGGFDDADAEVGDGDGVGVDGARAPPVYLTGAEIDAMVRGLDRLIERFEAEDFRLHLAGALPMTHRINEGMVRDLGIMLPTTLLLMSVVLALLFRRVGGVVLPLMIVTLSLLATIGVMIAIGIPGSTAVQILPVFLLTVGSATGSTSWRSSTDFGWRGPTRRMPSPGRWATRGSPC